MEPISYIFLYSKYSNNCSKLFSRIEQTQLDLSSVITLVCVDNETVRKRISTNKKINIQSVPCICCMFADGTLHTYEGIHAFNCIESLIAKLTPPVQSQVSQPTSPQVSQPSAPQPIQEKPQQRREIKEPEEIPVKEFKGTSIDEIINLPEQEENDIAEKPETEDDRHRIIPAPKRLQTADGHYEESDDLFPGERDDNRRQASKAIKPPTQKAEKDPNGVMARAKKLAQMRDQVEETINKPGSRGVFVRENPN